MFSKIASAVVLAFAAMVSAQCNGAGHSLCCNSVNVINHPSMAELFNFFDTGFDFSQDTIAAEGCSGGGNTCNTQSTCCQGVVQGFGVACNNFA